MRKRKIDKYFIRRMVALLLLILLIILIIFIFVKKEKNKDLSILLNNELITLKDKVIVDNSEKIYFSKEDVKEIFDDTIYYNEAEKELITTYNKHIALLKIDENYMMVNDAHVDLNSKLYEVGQKIYLPMNDLAIVYEMEINYAKDSNRIIIDSLSKAKTEAKVSSRSKVKENNSIFSKTIEKISSDSVIYILEDLGKYKKIRTQNGNIGYVKSKNIIEENKLRDDWKEEVKEINVLSDYKRVKSYEKITTDDNKLNVTLPDLLALDSDLKVIDKTSSNSKTFKDYASWAEESGVLVISSFKSDASVSKSFLTYAQRNNIINQLYEIIIKSGLKGINVNFENIDDINSFYRFIVELAPKFKESGLKVIVTANKNIDKEKIKNIVDYIIEE